MVRFTAALRQVYIPFAAHARRRRCTFLDPRIALGRWLFPVVDLEFMCPVAALTWPPPIALRTSCASMVKRIIDSISSLSNIGLFWSDSRTVADHAHPRTSVPSSTKRESPIEAGLTGWLKKYVVMMRLVVGDDTTKFRYRHYNLSRQYYLSVIVYGSCRTIAYRMTLNRLWLWLPVFDSTDSRRSHRGPKRFRRPRLAVLQGGR